MILSFSLSHHWIDIVTLADLEKFSKILVWIFINSRHTGHQSQLPRILVLWNNKAFFIMIVCFIKTYIPYKNNLVTLRIINLILISTPIVNKIILISTLIQLFIVSLGYWYLDWKSMNLKVIQIKNFTFETF